ncbi:MULTISPECIES: lipase family protein [unclassified Sphingomonas]|uniref:lipase family protein n=1 Tax=unclassified Sphingomonas TaxID=196159 RepID=UPI00030C89B2|nr:MULTISPECIES: Mbeg1-like protein [unclassified Sphingomonas]
MMSAADQLSRSTGTASSSAISTSRQLAANDDFQARHLPPRELLAWQQPVPPVPLVRSEAPQAAVERTGGPSTIDVAAMAADVYNDLPAPPADYRVASSDDLARLGLRAEDLTSPQSSFRARVYVAEGDGGPNYVVSFRGTTDGSDWKANAQQGVGLPSDQYTRALLIAKALGRHPDVQVTITGHSLGGGLASAAALASGRDAQTFNAAGLSGATIRQAGTIRGDAPAPKIAAFYVRGEVLSAIQDGGDRVAGAILGGIPGAIFADAPEAYGTRIPLDARQPAGQHWFQDTPVARHGMDWVQSSLDAH